MLAPVYDTNDELVNLASRLENSLGLKKGGSKKHESTVSNNHKVTSWRFNEWDYYKDYVPNQSRGLFTIDNKIIVRGYNKFFNIDEVPNTKMDNLCQTQGPYTVTVKENGCIIFVSGLEDGTIIVCSKHSTGHRDDLTRNHAVEGEKQLISHLESQGLSVNDLAKTLYQGNVTLVMELCDNSFEEHILSYEGKEAGLYLHGINYNTIDFNTYPMKDVETFADDWGFKKVAWFEIAKFDALMDYLKTCETTGTWQGREIEGFVIRCKKLENMKPCDFFFKYKFEQPYLIYRNFREVTKQWINGKPINEILKKFKDEKYILAKYLDFIITYFNENPELKELYLQGHGIIDIRRKFLKSISVKEISGMDLITLNQELAANAPPEIIKNKYIIIPVATVGCGKTVVSHTLASLFNWGHIQNDNISSKSKNQLVNDCLGELVHKDLVICDRNNHMKRERKQLFDQFYQYKLDYLSPNYNLQFIALNFVPPQTNKDDLLEVTMERIMKRGDNHQSIKSTSDPELSRKILSGFVTRFQPLSPKYEPDNEFDDIINVDFRCQPETTVQQIIDHIAKQYPEVIPESPSSDEIKASITNALAYTPTFTKTFGSQAKKPKKRVDYFALQVNYDAIMSVLSQVHHPSLETLKSLDRVQSEFHITLAHSAKSSTNQVDWENYHTLIGTRKDYPGEVQLSDTITGEAELINLVICHDTLICIEVKVNIPNVTILTQYPHITVGTFAASIKPFKSNVVLETLHNGTSNDIDVIPIHQTITNLPLFAHYYCK